MYAKQIQDGFSFVVKNMSSKSGLIVILFGFCDDFVVMLFCYGTAEKFVFQLLP